MQAIEAGKHIHFNKTMTTTAEEATQLIDAAAAKNVTLVASPGQMIPSSNKRIRKLIQDGVLGQPPGGDRGGLWEHARAEKNAPRHGCSEQYQSGLILAQARRRPALRYDRLQPAHIDRHRSFPQ